MVRLPAFSVAAAVVLTLAGLAPAAPVSYDESISGDLVDAHVLPVFNFEYGLNTLSGTIENSDNGDDWDAFAFVIPPGHSLTTGTVALADTTGDLANASWVFREGSLLRLTGTFVEVLAADSPGVDFLTTLPRGPGNYTIEAASMAYGGGAAYTFTFTVIPEPASLATLGLASFALLARRRTARG